MLYHISLFRKGVYDIPFDNEEVQQSTTLALQSVFNKLQVIFSTPFIHSFFISHNKI